MTESLQLLSDSPLLAALIAAFVPATFALGWLLRERKAASDKEASALQVQQLTADAELMRNHTAVEQRLYDWANVLLTKDLECCRSSPPAAPTSSDHVSARTALLVD